MWCGVAFSRPERTGPAETQTDCYFSVPTAAAQLAGYPHAPCGSTRAPGSEATGLTLPRLSRITRVTVSGNEVVPAGSGGAGSSAQLALGMLRTGLVVVLELTVPIGPMT